jgi:cysteine synthase
MADVTCIDTVGNTPLIGLQRLDADAPGRVLLKLENRNPLGSVKDRIARSMVEAAEEEGILTPGATIVEATSGNTGIGLAWIGAHRGYRVILTMPETMSVERRRLLTALGAEVILTPGNGGMNAAAERAEELVLERGAIMMRQFSNPANPRAHEKTTGPEIWEQSGKKVDVFVAGVGTGGTITGTGRFLRTVHPGVELIALEPEESPVLSGGSPGPHRIQGIGAGFVPEVLDTTLLSRVVTVSAEEAGAVARSLATEEGILGGVSGGANVAAALRIARDPAYAGKTIVTIVCDTGERYLSTWLYEEEKQ